MNRLKEILNQRGFKSVQLTDDCLLTLFPDNPFHYHFQKIWHNEIQMTAEEMEAVKNWLGLQTTDELIINKIS